MYNKISFECKYCKTAITKEGYILEIFEDKEIILYNNEVIKHNIQDEKNIELQKIELQQFGKKLEVFIANKNDNIFCKNFFGGYDLEISDDRIGIHTGKSWYVFTKEEAKDFVSESGLYCGINKNGKSDAYFSLSRDKKYIKECKYLICPLCQHKNFIPLKYAQLEINEFDYI